jgi:hypothetical protein
MISCLIRKESVSATPEEQVRQGLLRHLICDLGFPASHIAVEKALDQIPHLSISPMDLPDRRADIICFAQGIHPQHDLYPLLLVECKAVKLTPKVVNQVSGYNVFLQAYFIAAANQTEVQFGWKGKEGYQFIKRIPTYPEILSAIKK